MIDRSFRLSHFNDKLRKRSFNIVYTNYKVFIPSKLDEMLLIEIERMIIIIGSGYVHAATAACCMLHASVAAWDYRGFSTAALTMEH